MGTVYKATDCQTGADVALKVVRRTDLKDRFAREARVVATMDHKNIVRYIAHGVEASGELWLATEWLEGEDLAARLDRGPLAIDETLALANGVAQALDWAHGRGFVHRDIHPGNLFLPGWKASRVKVLDFGLARLVADLGEFTVTGMMMGPLEYMPPEQVTDAKRADARADIFSFGAVLFHCLTGRPACTGASTDEILANVVSARAPRVSEVRAETPESLASLVDRMLSKDPQRRPADGGAVLAALTRISVDPSWDSLTTLPVAVGVTLSRSDSFQDRTVRLPSRPPAAGGIAKMPRAALPRRHWGVPADVATPGVPMLRSAPSRAKWVLILVILVGRALVGAAFLLVVYQIVRRAWGL
jgi:serine/threonine protein kinase